MSAIERLAEAEAQAATARANLSQSLGILQTKLNPRALAATAARDLADAGKAGVDEVRRNPGALAGLVAIAGLFLARHKIAAMARRAAGKDTN